MCILKLPLNLKIQKNISPELMGISRIDGNLPIDGLAENHHLRLEMGMVQGVVDAHRTAEHHEAVVAVYVRDRFGVALEVHVADPEARLLE